jgi:hypothetical protein
MFKQGFLNLAYENNFLRDAHIFEVGLRYAFNFAQTSATSRIGNRNSSFVQSARGSLMLDDNTGYIAASNRTAMSRAAVSIIPFLDFNQNGIKDPMEPGIAGLELKNRSGRVSYSDDKTVLRITELQPYIDLMIELDPLSLDNIAWKIPNPKILVKTQPNHFKEIYVPVQVMGEVGGMVYFKNGTSLRGQGRILINIIDANGNKAAELLSEGDGYFSYLGLAPGKYTAEIDAQQLETLSYKAAPAKIDFEIEIDEYGDIEDTLEFILSPAE